VSEHPSQQPSESPRLLIVEDDPDLAEMLMSYFRIHGYEVTSAAWGEEAMRLSQAAPPDLAILDIRLPDIDGYDVCRRLRTQRRTQDVPVIFLTEKRDRVDKLAGLELGVVDYITKPFDIQELRLRVRNTLRRATHAAQVNSVTHLPEGAVVAERMAALLHGSEAWSAVEIAVEGLPVFRERYGFVAADDVLRAVALMIGNALRDRPREADFAGHLDAHTFVILTGNAHAGLLRERLEARLQQSIAFFYPLRDREHDHEQARAHRGGPALRLFISQLESGAGPFADVSALRRTLEARRVLAAE